MTGLPTVDVYFDYVSNFSYYLAHRLDFAERFEGAALQWKPIDLFALSNFEERTPYTPSKRRCVVLDGIRSQEYYGIPTTVPKPFPMGDLETARLRSREPEITKRARSLVREAESRGVFGVPTLVLDEELFWGNDRLEMLAWRLARRGRT